MTFPETNNIFLIKNVIFMKNLSLKQFFFNWSLKIFRSNIGFLDFNVFFFVQNVENKSKIYYVIVVKRH